MEGLVDEGLVKSIGLSNFTEEQMERILAICKHKPVVNQVEIHPYCPQFELEEFCEKHHILLEAYAPLGGANESAVLEKGHRVLLEDPIIASIAEQHHVQPAELLLRYIIDRQLICIAKSSNLKRLEENFRLFEQTRFQLTDEDFQRIRREISTRFRYYLMNDAFGSKHHPFPPS